MVLIFTAGNRHLFKVIFFKLKSAWILLILAAERGGGEHEPVCPVFVHLSRGCQRGPASEGCELPAVQRDHSSQLSCWRVLLVLAPTLAGQSLCLRLRVALSRFLLLAAVDRECLAAQRELCCPVLACMEPSPDPVLGGPAPAFVPGWFGPCRSVGSSLVLWVLAMAPRPGFAGSMTFTRVLAAGLPL